MPPELRPPLAVTLGAVPGALSRYYLGLWLSNWLGQSFPVATFLINIIGCLAMGFFVGGWPAVAPDLRLLVAVGFLGSYTTFSTYALDTIVLLQTQQPWPALIYWLGSAILGVLALAVGRSLGNIVT